ncbi:MAG TPA: DUF3501 family protein [Acidimicrobiales bacterium]|nr:DUF3501 family protein [Acidimicrobiales bacterium]
MTIRPLTLDDISDLRAYERERDEFRRAVIAEKKIRRVSVGPVVTLTFESRTTVRFQVQEMARAERLTTDAQVQQELDVYNRLLPARGELSATLFLELTSEEQLRTWLPRLVGIEHSATLLIGEGTGARSVRSVPEGDHLHQLTRDDVTSAVHYVRFPFTPSEVATFASGPATLVVDHPGYPEGRPGVLLPDATRAALTEDLTAP